MTFDPGSGHLEVLRRHVEKHDVFKGRTAAGSGLFPGAEFKAAAPTLVVAAFNSLATTIRRADYGCNGTDDHVEIQQAIDALPFDGGRILLTEGEFHPDWDLIKLPHDVHIQGMGVGSTIINMNDTNPTTGVGPAIGTTGGGGNGSISNLSIYMPATGLSTQVGIEIGLDFFIVDNVEISFCQGRGIEMIGANDWITIRNCFIEFTELAGIWDDGLGNNYLKIINNTIHAMGAGYAVDMSQGCYFTTIEDNQITGPGDGGIFVSQPDHLLIANNQIELSSSVRGPIRVDTSGAGGTSPTVVIADNIVNGGGSDGGIHLADIDNAIVEGNVVWLAVGSGIFVTDCVDISVRGNHVYQSDLHGIEIVNTVDSIISDNRIVDPGQVTDNTQDGIILTNSDRNFLYGNKVTPEIATSPRYGINISTSTSDDNRVGFNDVDADADYGTGAINDAGTGTRRVNAQPHLLNVGGVLVIGTGLSEVPMLQPGRVVGIRARVSTAPTGAAILVDLDKNNVTMYTTQGNRPTIADAAKDSGNATLPDITEFVAGDYLSLNVDQIGSTIAGSDLVVQVLVEYL